MRPTDIPPRGTREAGFTLPSILVVVGALLILAVGILLVVGIERSTARSFSDRQRAELAARAGLEDIKGILNLEAANDDFMVLQSALATPITPGSQSAPQLFLARGKVEGAGYSYRYVPLFSTRTLPQANKTIAPPTVEPLVGTAAEEYLDFTTLPYNDKVRASWLPVKDDKDRTVARYAYWVEDLQSRIDPAITGNEKGGSGAHARAAWPFPAAGLNPKDLADTEPTLDQVALYAVDPAATSDSQGDLGKTLIKNRKLLISPDSLLAAAGIEPPLDRLKAVGSGKIGELVNLKSRAVEEGLSSGLQSYMEQPLVPFADGIDPSAAGKPKLNLNKLLATGGGAAVDEMADFIEKALPKWSLPPPLGRKGGFPDNYIKTLAANAIDYADSDPNSTMGTGYRGLDAYPLVSEFLMRFRWDDVKSEGGRKYLVLKVATYVELWNMTDQIVSGTAQFSHDTRYSFPLGANPEVSLADMSEATPVLTKSDDVYWFPPTTTITLNPNEYRMFKCGEVTYKIDAGSSSIFIPSPLLLQGEAYGQSGAGYKLKWNNQIVDQSRGGIHRNDSSLKFPATGSGAGAPQAVRTTIPAHSYKTGPSQNDFIDNMGDSRMSYYLTAPQDASAYPQNYSPNRRNIRYEIYLGGTSKVYGRVMPSEWPDGGHNSTCENTNGLTQKDTQLEPDAVPFQLSANSILRNPPADEAPMRLSDFSKAGNVSRYFSATELGRVYDPIQWDFAPPTGANLPWGDVQVSTPADSKRGGGNTLKIGRPEHPMFDKITEPGMEARRLLDLFHAGLSRSASATEREGPLVQIQGQVNLNTASRDALRAIAVGALTMDPKIAKRIVETHTTTGLMAPQVKPFKMTAAEINAEAGRIADAIILARKTAPFTSPSALAEVRDSTSPTANLVFGNKNLITDGAKVNRTDSAAEEVFARVYEASTVRSRNYRIWVVGQAVAPTTSATAAPQVLSEVRKVFTVFADPGTRASDGKIDPTKTRLTILNENDF